MDPEDLLKDSTDVKAVEDGIKSMMWEHDFQQTPNETGLKVIFAPSFHGEETDDSPEAIFEIGMSHVNETQQSVLEIDTTDEPSQSTSTFPQTKYSIAHLNTLIDNQKELSVEENPADPLHERSSSKTSEVTLTSKRSPSTRIAAVEATLRMKKVANLRSKAAKRTRKDINARKDDNRSAGDSLIRTTYSAPPAEQKGRIKRAKKQNHLPGCPLYRRYQIDP